MSTPQDPRDGDRDRARPSAGGWGALGPSDPSADPPTPAWGTPAVGETRAGEAGGTGAEQTAETPRYGWDAASGPVPQGDPAWQPGGASDWSTGAERDPWAPDAEHGGRETGGAAAVGADGGWDPQRGAVPGGGPHATSPGWDPRGGHTGEDAAGSGGWDPRTGQQPAQPAEPAQGGWDPRGGAAGPQRPWDPRRAGDPAAETTAVVAQPRPGRKGGGRRLPLLIGGIVGVVVVAAVLVLGFWKPGFLVVSELDQQALQSGVTQILTRDYGLQVTALSCPHGQRVTPGNSFTCAATVDGENVQVPVTVLDDKGTYQVGRV